MSDAATVEFRAMSFEEWHQHVVTRDEQGNETWYLDGKKANLIDIALMLHEMSIKAQRHPDEAQAPEATA